MKRSITIATLISVTGCATFPGLQSLGERESGYTYVPIDPFPVQTTAGDSCEGSTREAQMAASVLDALPDNAVRMLVEKFDRKGAVTYGPSKLGARGESYRVTVDYINADTINVPMTIKKFVRQKDGSFLSVPLLAATAAQDQEADFYEVRRVLNSPGTVTSKDSSLRDADQINIPVYVGIGLRVAANIEVIGSNANISGIGVIGAEAEAERVKGSLIVQTLGVNGKSISAALPIQSELNRTTAQNAIVAVGSIKALLYAGDTIVVPRVVGLYLPFPGGKPLVSAIISELSKQRVAWPRPCPIRLSSSAPAAPVPAPAPLTK